MFVDIGLKFYAVPSQPTRATLRSRSWVIDFDKFSDKAQVRRAKLSCDSSYLKISSYIDIFSKAPAHLEMTSYSCC